MLSLCSLGRIFNWNVWIIDITSHFSLQYAAIAVVLLFYSLWRKVIPVAVVSGMLLFLNIGEQVDLNNAVHASLQKKDSFKICSANINKTNRDFTKIIAGLTEIDADILLLLEVTEHNIQHLQQFIQTYPYRTEDLNTGFSGTGAVLVSRFPILEHEVTKYSEFGNMLISATLQVKHHKVRFYGAHFPKPTDISEFSARFEHILALARQIRRQSLPVILEGDFNSTPYSPVFKELIKISALRDSRTGFGLQPSWPTYLPLLLIPIDHILVGPDIEVLKRDTGPYIGSDHYPVFAEISIH